MSQKTKLNVHLLRSHHSDISTLTIQPKRAKVTEHLPDPELSFPVRFLTTSSPPTPPRGEARGSGGPDQRRDDPGRGPVAALAEGGVMVQLLCSEHWGTKTLRNSYQLSEHRAMLSAFRLSM